MHLHFHETEYRTTPGRLHQVNGLEGALARFCHGSRHHGASPPRIHQPWRYSSGQVCLKPALHHLKPQKLVKRDTFLTMRVESTRQVETLVIEFFANFQRYAVK